jgi:TRL-like protein family
MKTIALLTILILTAFTLTGCLYTHVTMPLSTELNKTDLGHKKGESSIYSVIWLFAWGDGGAAAAAKNGEITVMTHMDRELYSIVFGIYTHTKTIVYGD